MKNRNKGLTPGAASGTLCEAYKSFKFMSTCRTQQLPFEEVAVSEESGAISALRWVRNLFASNKFRKSPQRFARTHFAILLCEQPVVQWLLGITATGRLLPSFSTIGALLVAMVLSGCGGTGFAYEKHLSGKYGLVAGDVLEQLDVSEILPSGDAVGVIPETVFAVGWDEHFIIAKQHPNDVNQHIDKSVTKFYILRVADGSLTGPIDEPAFSRERAALGVPADLGFTLVFDSLK
jgi:hypothetical protein